MTTSHMLNTLCSVQRLVLVTERCRGQVSDNCGQNCTGLGYCGRRTLGRPAIASHGQLQVAIVVTRAGRVTNSPGLLELESRRLSNSRSRPVVPVL